MTLYLADEGATLTTDPVKVGEYGIKDLLILAPYPVGVILRRPLQAAPVAGDDYGLLPAGPTEIKGIENEVYLVLPAGSPAFFCSVYSTRSTAAPKTWIDP